LKLFQRIFLSVYEVNQLYFRFNLPKKKLGWKGTRPESSERQGGGDASAPQANAIIAAHLWVQTN